MNDSLSELNDLPDEILIHIFKQLYNAEVLYSLVSVNQHIDRIVHDPMLTRHLCLLQYFPNKNSTFRLSDAILDRFCSTILSQIGHQITTLHLERISVERILRTTNYPNLETINLYDIDMKTIDRLFGYK